MDMSDEPQNSEQAAAPETPARKPERAAGRLFGRASKTSPGKAPSDASGSGEPPPRRKRHRLEALSGLLTFLLVAAAVAALAFGYAGHAVRRPGPLTADKTMIISPGSENDDIAEQLASAGIIESTTEFSLALLFEGARSKLKAGEYLFKQGASLQDVIDEIVQGRAVLHALTIPEGLTSRQIVERLRAEEALAGDIHEVPREGALLPETYKFQRGDSRDKLLQKMARDQKQMVDDIWRRRAPDLPLASPYDLVTLASIVEKETGRADERPRVAAVFINRLRKHMRLQSDPTIVYGIVGGQGPLGRPLTRSDIDTPNRYNTYAIDGLPPGPIANPGRAAMEAVANPAKTNALYFVADGTGGHVFSESLDAHNRNVQQWRQIEQNNKAKAGPNAVPGRDDRTELAPPNFGLPPRPEEFAARRNLSASSRPRLARDPAAIARLAPMMPDAPPPPLRVADLDRTRAPAPRIDVAGTLDNVEFGNGTRAEMELDGPAVDVSAPQPGRARMAANSGSTLDGPAEPVEESRLGSALGYAGAPVNAAPNGRPRIFDASEGTALDPLRNKSWDLNSAKSVDVAPEKTEAQARKRN
jgi:UPF0755 protein